MDLGTWSAVIGGIITIISFVSWISYRLIRSEIRDEFIPIISSNFETLNTKINDSKAELEKQIEDDSKKTRNYMGIAFSEKLKYYEDHNEEKRVLRSEKYMQTIEMIQKSIEKSVSDHEKTNAVIMQGLESIKMQINDNQYKTKDNTKRIEVLENNKGKQWH